MAIAVGQSVSQSVSQVSQSSQSVKKAAVQLSPPLTTQRWRTLTPAAVCLNFTVGQSDWVRHGISLAVAYISHQMVVLKSIHHRIKRRHQNSLDRIHPQFGLTPASRGSCHGATLLFYDTIIKHPFITNTLLRHIHHIYSHTTNASPKANPNYKIPPKPPKRKTNQPPFPRPFTASHSPSDLAQPIPIPTSSLHPPLHPSYSPPPPRSHPPSNTSPDNHPKSRPYPHHSSR